MPVVEKNDFLLRLFTDALKRESCLFVFVKRNAIKAFSGGAFAFTIDNSCFFSENDLQFSKEGVYYFHLLYGMPTWRNGRRAAFRSQSAYAGEGSSPFVGTISFISLFFLMIQFSSPFCLEFFRIFSSFIFRGSLKISQTEII